MIVLRRGRGWLLLVGLLVAASGWAQGFPGDKVQDLRRSHRLSVLGWDEALAASCRQRSQALVESGQLSHFDDQGRGPGEQLVGEGFPPGLYGEVIGAGHDPQQVWQAWLASGPHRAVLVDPRWVAWGWGAISTGSTTIWVVRFRGQ